MTFADAHAVIAAALAENLVTSEALPVDAWADRYRYVAKGDPPGPWRTDGAPHTREPMQAFDTEGVEEVVLMWPPQVAGKTEIQLNCLLWAIANAPDDAFFVLESLDKARKMSRARLAPSIRQSPGTEHLAPTDRATDQLLMLELRNGMTIWLAGSNSAANLATFSARYIFADEIDKWPQQVVGRGAKEGSALELATARADRFGDRRRIVKSSTPTEEGVGIAAEFALSSGGERFYPCPHCGQWQRLRWGQVVLPRDERTGDDLQGWLREIDDAEVAAYVELCTDPERGAHLACAHNGCVITERERRRMLLHGQWVHVGQDIDGIGPGALVVGEPRTRRVWGGHMSWLDVAGKTIGDCAAEWAKRRGTIDAGFANRVLAEPWRVTGGGATAEQLERIVVRDTERAQATNTMYRRGEVPADVVVLVGFIDIQKDHAKVQVAGYGEGGCGENRYLIDFFDVPWLEVLDEAAEGVRDAAADELVEVLQRRRWKVQGRGEDDPGRLCDWWGIDSGYRTEEVYQLMRRCGPHVHLMKGHEQELAIVVSAPPVPGQAKRNSKRSAAQERDRNLLNYQNLHWKDKAFGMLHRETWHWPVGVPRQYLRQLAAEQRVDIRKHGLVIGRRWVPKPGDPPNHWWDCTVGEVALVHYLFQNQQIPRTAKRRTTETAKAPPRGRKGPRVRGVRV